MTQIQHIVINDGQFKFPVLKANVDKVGKTKADLKAMNGEQYSAWCQDVGMDGSRGDVGSQGCIDFCDELEQAGADVWQVA